MIKFKVLLFIIAVLSVGCNQKNKNSSSNSLKPQNEIPSIKDTKPKLKVNFKLTLPETISEGKVAILSSDGDREVFSFMLQTNELEEDLDLDAAGLYQLKIGDRKGVPVLFTPADSAVQVKVNNNSFVLDYEISGSKETFVFQEYLTRFSPGKAHDIADKLKFLDENSPSYAAAAIYSLEFLAGVYPYVDKLNEIKTVFKNHSYAVSLLTEIDVLTAGELGYGKTVPDFKLNELSTKTLVGPSSYRDKYLLIDFWASWCGPCRAENPNVKKIYKSYSRDDFEVLGVSIDRSVEKWEGVILQDSLLWNHVRDGDNMVTQKYGVNAVPSIFLIDRKGKIVGKNLRGKALEEAMKFFLAK